MPAYHHPLKSLALALAMLPLSGYVHAAGSSFADGLDSQDLGRWVRSNDVFAGGPVDNDWRADHVAYAGGQMELRLNTSPCAWAPEQCGGRSSTSGQLVSTDTYGMGRYTAVLKAASGQGVVTDFMKYTGALVGTPTDLVGMHIQGQDPTRMQVSYYQADVGAQYRTVNLGFDASAGLHTYAFDASGDALRWYVDSSEVFSVVGGALPVAQGRIVSDVWAANPTTAPLFGAYTGTATRAYFDSISFQAAVAPVPEPASALMFVSGAGLLAWRRRRADVAAGVQRG
ncbi:family 16 glycosylhydrolase [Sphaerotilus sp.]|jgi:endo-1,3-1,4-beta-glycanase ExoK|uniref:family 16 glycosylhydrolase n=1 Tax=Sphaerotilus sp. TaxID=2093942 RepID=UPI0025E328FC|nr:family 16 glycosylhydrolase [Sphaerotilus sp.]